MTEADMAMKFGQPELGLNMLMVADSINQRLESAMFASRSGLRDLNVDMLFKQADHVIDSMGKCQSMLE